MKKTIVAVALAVFFVLAIAAPAFAIVHIASYDMDGDIYMDKQVGHFCNTGAEQLQTIRGTGKMTKMMDARMVKGKVMVNDKNDFVTAPNAVRNLVVTSVITLCTPPKYTYEGLDVFGNTLEAPVATTAMYAPWTNYPADYGFNLGVGLMGGGYVWNPNTGTNVYSLADEFGWDAVSEQIWAVRVEANPGFSGNLHQDYEAAYGGFWGANGIQSSEADWEQAALGVLFNRNDRWRWEVDEDGIFGLGVGKKFVGDYFKMTQLARTSDGDVKRYIDISSPWSGAYLYEDFEVAGFAEIADSFTMINLPAGADTVAKWWKDLFDN